MDNQIENSTPPYSPQPLPDPANMTNPQNPLVPPDKPSKKRLPHLLLILVLLLIAGNPFLFYSSKPSTKLANVPASTAPGTATNPLLTYIGQSPLKDLIVTDAQQKTLASLTLP